MNSKIILWFGLTIIPCLASGLHADGRIPYKYADCEFTESYEETSYKCSATVMTCVSSAEYKWERCRPRLSVFCDEGDMYQGSWQEGVYGKYLRIQGKMRHEEVILAESVAVRSVVGPIIDIFKDSSKGYPSRLQLYGKTMSGYCAMYTPDDAPVPGTPNP